MAEDHLKRSASFRSIRRDEPSFEEDPLIELARIVAEDGGFRRHRTPELRPARNEPGRQYTPAQEEAIANQLEAELLQQWESDEHGADVGRRAVTELRAAGGVDQAEPAHLPLRPAGDGSHWQRSRFPEIILEDARPAPAPAREQHGDWRQEVRAPRQEVAEPFEQELHALLRDPEAPRRATADDGPTEEDGEAVSFAGYQESYGQGYSAEIEESYSAEVEEFEAGSDVEPESDAFFAEEEGELAAVRPERARRGRAYRGLIAAVGVLGVVLLGGAVAALVGGVGAESDSGSPPVIRAEAGPLKVKPEETAQAQPGDGTGQAVYDRVAGRAPKGEEKLVDRAEEPRQVSRIVLPQAAGGSQGASEAASGSGKQSGTEVSRAQPESAQAQERIVASISSETARTDSGPRVDPVGPRRVRTLTVRPDGSIAPAPAPAPAPAHIAQAAPEPQKQAEADSRSPDPVPVRTVRIEDDGAERTGELRTEPAGSPSGQTASPQAFAPIANSSQTAPPSAGEVDAAGAEPLTDSAAPPEEEIAMLPRARPDEVPAAVLRTAAAQRPEPERAAAPAPAARSGQPVDLLAAGPAAPRVQTQPSQPREQAARPATASSPYAVQLSAQRSEDQARATFADMRNRFPSILGGHQAQIERADLGERGVYYRVRVGASSQAEAAQLCEQLKAAGGSCFVTR